MIRGASYDSGWASELLYLHVRTKRDDWPYIDFRTPGGISGYFFKEWQPFSFLSRPV